MGKFIRHQKTQNPEFGEILIEVWELIHKLTQETKIKTGSNRKSMRVGI
jgi:hypothetical protein